MATKRAGGKKTALAKTSSTDVFAGYDELLRDLKARIEQAQVRAVVAVNRELVMLYWSNGRDILNRQQQQGWGAKVIDRLAAGLHCAFPEVKGFSRTDLLDMPAFADAYHDEQFVQQDVAQIPWRNANMTDFAKMVCSGRDN